MSKKITAPSIRSMKLEGKKIVCLTAYDYTSGLICDESGADLILVGDSLGTVIHGSSTTTGVTLEEVCYHTRLTRKGVSNALLVADLPFGSYGSSVAQSVMSATSLVRSGAEAVKLEGTFLDEIRAIIKVGIPVMGHVGMTPQSVNNFGGHRVQGQGEGAARVLEHALELQEAGVFAIVLELIKADVALDLSKKLTIPTIGIGAGAGCDGQIQVFHDVVGLWPKQFKHAHRFANGKLAFVRGLRKYAKEVREGTFPTKDNSF